MIRNASPSSPLMPALIPILDSDDEEEIMRTGVVCDDDDADANLKADTDADSVDVAVTVKVLVTVSVVVLLIGVVEPDVRL